ncbi:MAG TPA: aldehyde dehydrogenase family protein [Nocardioidaceae bacterium]|nr:aldehyde dehydrogenase family protein [Nocardioidaceae bacterium]
MPVNTLIDTEKGLLHVLRPADGTLIEDLVVDDAARVAAKANQLRDAQPEWEAMGLEARTRWMERYRDWLLDHTHELAGIMQEEAGKVRTEAVLEQSWLHDIINTYSRKAPALLGDKRVKPGSPLLLGKRFTLVRRPHPLVGVIGPWNFPMVLCLGDGLPALFAGCAVLLKPSEVTPLAVRRAVEGWAEIGAPPVLDVVLGAGETGAALVDEVDYVQFTGSVATGQKIAERASKTITPVSLELGGKDPFLVLEGANLERAANCAVVGGFGNNGQVCISTERVYVQASVYDEFVAKVATKVKALRSGYDGPEIDADVGAMTSPAQIGIVEAHVNDAIAKGATVLTGGRREDKAGDWFQPTVVVDVDHTMRIMVEETFGPVLPIMKVADEAEAIRLANDSEFGLAASVFASSPREGERIARLLDAGTVNVDDYAIAAMCIDVPMGGWKKSGIGQRSADYGLTKFTRQKTISAPRVPTLDSEMWWFPYTPTKVGLVQKVMRFVNARGRARLGTPALKDLS